MYLGGINIEKEDFKTNLPDNLSTQNGYQGIWYDQTKVSNWSCSIHAPLTILSNLYGIEVSLKDRQELWKKALENGAVEGQGRYTDKAIKFVVDWFDEKYNTDTEKYKLSILNKDFKKAMVEKTGLIVSYKGTKLLNEAIGTDSRLDNDEKIQGSHTYGHITTLYPDGEGYKIIDSFKQWNGNNIRYISSKKVLKKLVEKDIFYSNCYVLLPKQTNMGDIEKQDVKSLLYNLKSSYNHLDNENVKGGITNLADILREEYDIE